jgi:hypothetical protein
VRQGKIDRFQRLLLLLLLLMLLFLPIPFPGAQSRTNRATASLLLVDCLSTLSANVASRDHVITALMMLTGTVATHQWLSNFLSSHTLKAHSTRQPADFPALSIAVSTSLFILFAAEQSAAADDVRAQKSAGSLEFEAAAAAVRMCRGIKDRKQILYCCCCCCC